MEEVFEGLETVDVDMITTRFSKIIESILNRNFGNYFHRHNGPNQRQYVHKHTGQWYRYRPFQISKNLLPPYLKKKCIRCGLVTKEVKELLIKHDRKLETFPFIYSFFIKKKSTLKQLLQNNHKHGSRPNNLNTKIDTSISGPPKATFLWNKP